MANGAHAGPGGNGWGTGVVVKIQPAPEADVTVEAIKTSCKCWASGSMVAEREGKGGEVPGPETLGVARFTKQSRPGEVAQMYYS